MDRRVVITGIGVVAPGGLGKDGFWRTITSGRSAVRAITAIDPSQFRSRIAAECDFDPVALGLTPREIRRMDRAAQFAVVAAREALDDSGLRGEARAHRTGVTIGTAQGCSISLDQEYVVASDSGTSWLVDHTYATQYMYDYFVPSSIAAEVAWLADAQGPTNVVSTGCTSGLDSIGYACGLVREGSADVMIAGATDAPITPISIASFDAIKATTPRNDDPLHASRPFDRNRDGFVLGEGSAVLVLEEYEHARKRGARIYAEIVGFAARSNAYSMTGLRNDGAEMAAAITAALDRAQLNPTDIGYVNAHGSGTKQNDRHETAAIKASLAEHAYRVPISSIKSMIGHSLGAVGSIEVAACALTIQNGLIPPTANLHEPDPELDLDYVPLVAKERDVDVALCVGSGFGGFQSAMVLSRVGGRA